MNPEHSNPESATIAFVINNLGSGGAQRVLTILANAWAATGRRVWVISIDGTEEDFFELSEDVRRIVLDVKGPSISIFKLNGLYMTAKRILAIRKAIKDISPDVVIAFLGVVNILTLLATLGVNTRVVISERNDPALQNLGFGWEQLRKLLYRYADVVSANTRAALATMRKYVPERKLAFVPNPVQGPGKVVDGSKRANELLAVGSLRHQKAYDILLQACALAFREAPEWRLVIVGDGELRDDLQALVGNLEIESKVVWAGRTAPEEYYERARIFVLPSRHEGTPNALLEAMSHGLPSVVSDASPGPLEYAINEQTGLVVPVDAPGVLAAAILRLIRDENLRTKLGNAALKRLAGNRIDTVLGQWERAIGIG